MGVRWREIGGIGMKSKQELMETYTAEQLAEMVVELQKEKTSKSETIYLPKNILVL